MHRFKEEFDRREAEHDAREAALFRESIARHPIHILEELEDHIVMSEPEWRIRRSVARAILRNEVARRTLLRPAGRGEGSSDGLLRAVDI